PADRLRSSPDEGQIPLEERVKRPARIDAPDRVDLDLRDRLLVRDDREGLEPGPREADFAPGPQHPLDPGRALPSGEKLVAAGDLHENHAAVGLAQVPLQRFT